VADGEHGPKRRRRQPGQRVSGGPRKAERSSEVRASATELLVRKRPDGMLELVHPHCARDREDDARQAQEMVSAGEIEVARDELRWLLQGCSDNLAIHVLLGDIALAEADFPLARGHFGYAFQIAQKALRRAGLSGTLPADLPANQAFFAAAKGLVFSLVQLGKRAPAEEVVRFTVECDSRDPMGVQGILARGANADSDR